MGRYLSVILYAILCLIIITAVRENWINAYFQIVIMFIGINVILSTSLNIINGNMGEFAVGHAAFMAVGAYVSSILNMMLFTKDRIFGDALLGPDFTLYLFPVTLIAGAVAASLAGVFVAIPSFRTRGDYLAIITLAVNYIVKSAIENMQVIGGARGFMGMRKIVNIMQDTINLPWIMIWVLVFTGLTVYVIYCFINSTYGKGIIAIKDDEIAAEIMSVNTKRMKLVAFMLSAGLAGIAGGLFAHVLGYINPGSFTIMKSTEVMVMVYLGGMGSLSGAVLSAVVFTVLMEILRPLQVLKWVLIPLLLIILMLFRPEGFLGDKELTHAIPGLKKYFKKRQYEDA